nr:high mobility group B protein 6-like isoform X1 [Ipomoea batatas]
MADVAAADAIPAKKGKSRKALKNRKASSSEANIMAASVSDAPVATIPAGESAEKENHEGLCPKNSKKEAKKQTEESSFEKEILEMQEKLQQLKIEKEQSEELLKAKEEMLIQKEKEQEKLQTELKKLQKINEFKPNLGDKDEEKKVKKAGTHEKREEEEQEQKQKSGDTHAIISGEEAKQHPNEEPGYLVRSTPFYSLCRLAMHGRRLHVLIHVLESRSHQSSGSSDQAANPEC